MTSFVQHLQTSAIEVWSMCYMPVVEKRFLAIHFYNLRFCKCCQLWWDFELIQALMLRLCHRMISILARKLQPAIPGVAMILQFQDFLLKVKRFQKVYSAYSQKVSH